MQEVWVMLALLPNWCELIIDGKKGWDIRKTMPKRKPPFKVLMYETKDKRYDGIGVHWADGRDFIHHIGKVIGEFVCDRIDEVYQCNSGWVWENARVSKTAFFDYLGIPRDTHMGYDKKAYAWHITDLVIYDQPKDLSTFYKCGAETFEELSDREELCKYCSDTDYGKYGSYGTPNGPVFCEGRWCDKAYQEYLDENFALIRPPQSWCYVEVRR